MLARLRGRGASGRTALDGPEPRQVVRRCGRLGLIALLVGLAALAGIVWSLLQ